MISRLVYTGFWELYMLRYALGNSNTGCPEHIFIREKLLHVLVTSRKRICCTSSSFKYIHPKSLHLLGSYQGGNCLFILIYLYGFKLQWIFTCSYKTQTLIGSVIFMARKCQTHTSLNKSTSAQTQAIGKHRTLKWILHLSATINQIIIKLSKVILTTTKRMLNVLSIRYQ